MAGHEIMVYALSTCSHCKNARRLLDECNVEYQHVDVDLCEGEERETIIAQVRGFNPNLSFPTLVIDGEVIVGYKEKEIRAAIA